MDGYFSPEGPGNKIKTLEHKVFAYKNVVYYLLYICIGIFYYRWMFKLSGCNSYFHSDYLS